ARPWVPVPGRPGRRPRQRSRVHLHLLLEDPLTLGHREMARGRMVTVGGKEQGDLVLAPIERVRAPGMERAPRRDEDQRGWESRDRIQPLVLDVEAWDRT